MFHGNNTSAESLFFMLCEIFVIISTFPEATGKYATLPKPSRCLEKPKDGCVLRSTVKRKLREYLNFADMVTMNDDQYPEEELVHIVEETKKIIQNHDKVSRKRIKIDKSYDSSYLEGKNHKLISSEVHRNFILMKSGGFLPAFNNFHVAANLRPEDKSCILSETDWKPRFLENHYVINTQNLEQTIKIRKCRENKTCGSVYTNPVIGYKNVCTQEYKVVEFVAHPTDKEFNITNQELLSVRIQSDCKCSRLRDS